MMRTVWALSLREMSTTYGRSALGYLWALLEPVAGILLLTSIFSLTFSSPPLGTDFPLFYASGYLPFMLYLAVSQKLSVALRFSRSLLFYARVTFVDALAARLFVNLITQILVAAVVIQIIVMFGDLDLIIRHAALANGFFMAVMLAAGVGTLNCYLLSVFPTWEQAWAILNRPLFIISGVLFLPDAIPAPYQQWMLLNPLVHIIGEVRRGIYVTYEAPYVSSLFVYAISLVCLTAGLVLLRRHYRFIIND